MFYDLPCAYNFQLDMSLAAQKVKILNRKVDSNTVGPPLTRKSLTRFPLTRFLAYVRVSGGISVSRGPQHSPTNTSFM